MSICNNFVYFQVGIGFYIITILAILVTAIFILYKIVILNFEYVNRKDLSRNILIMISFLTCLTVVTYIFLATIGGRILSGKKTDFGFLPGSDKPDRSAFNFFAVRSILLTISVAIAWFMYYQFQKSTEEGEFSALRWAFAFYSMMIIVFIVTIIIFVTQYKRMNAVCDINNTVNAKLEENVTLTS